MTKQDLITLMENKIKVNGQKKITGGVLQDVLSYIIEDSHNEVIDSTIAPLIKHLYYKASTKQIILVKKDGSKVPIDMSDLADDYIGSSTDTITVSVDPGDKEITAEIIDESITEQKLISTLKNNINGKIDSAQIGSTTVTKTGTRLDFPASYPAANQLTLKAATGDVHTWLSTASDGFYYMIATYQDNGNNSKSFYLGVKSGTQQMIHLMRIDGLPNVTSGYGIKIFDGTSWSGWLHIGSGAYAMTKSPTNPTNMHDWLENASMMSYTAIGAGLASGAPNTTEGWHYIGIREGAFQNILAFPRNGVSNNIFQKRCINNVWGGWTHIGDGSNADMVDNLHIATNTTAKTSPAANQLIRSDASGYTHLGWISTVSGNVTTIADSTAANASRIFIETGDDGYIRKCAPPILMRLLTRMTGVADQSYYIGMDGSYNGSYATKAQVQAALHGTTIGSATQPVYVNGSGVITAITGAIANNTSGSSASCTGLAAQATRLGTSGTAAGATALVLGNGTAAGTFGSAGTGFINLWWINAGVPSSHTTTVGGPAIPAYVNAGGLQACTVSSTSSSGASTLVGRDTNIRIYASGGFHQESDERLKTVTGEIDKNKILDDIATLRKIYYVMNEGNTPESIGVIAQEVQAICPQIISTDEETGHLSVDYPKLSVLALAAVDTLSDEVKKLNKRMDDIEEIIKKLNAKF